jgi:sterol 24-C-methyltransferase
MPALDLYRLTTRLRALRKLYSLEQKEIDAFLDSYRLFEGGWGTANGKREEQIIDYYSVLNHLCALGNVEKMYIPPHMDERTGVAGNQELFEQKMMRDIGARPGMRILDLGCGRGRVAHHVASRTGAHVTGINIDPSQVESAREFARSKGFEDRTGFRVHSLNERLPFEDGTFDGAYQIQAFTYAKDLGAVCRELARVLKPGARFSALDWVLLPAYDEHNPVHVDLVGRACGILGAIACPSLQEFTNAVEKAGFRIEVNEIPSIDEQQHRMISAEDRYFRWLRRGVRIGTKTRVLPRYLLLLVDRLMQDADAFIELDRMRIGTTCYQIVGEKPDE